MKMQAEPQLRNVTATNFMRGRSLLLSASAPAVTARAQVANACRQKRMTLQRRARNDERLHAASGNIRNIALNAAVFAAAGKEFKK